MLLHILAAFQVVQCWLTLLTGAARSIAFRNRRKLIKDEVRLPAEGTTPDGVQQGRSSLRFIRFAPSVDARGGSKRQRL